MSLGIKEMYYDTCDDMVVVVGNNFIKKAERVSNYFPIVVNMQIFDIFVNEEESSFDIIPLNMRTLELDYGRKQTEKLWVK